MNKLLLLLILLPQLLVAQVVNTATMDTSDYAVKGKFTVEGYIDGYYAYNFNKPSKGDQPYLVSMARHNEMNINLAFVDLKYSSSRVRARIVPGFGTFINSNYAAEDGTLKNFIEANAGYRLFKNKNVWIDAGVLGSPYTNESAISKDHLAYTRSLAAEFVPYYLSGMKLTIPAGSSLNVGIYLFNGWQQIRDQNSCKSVGTQLEWRPNDNVLLNWNTFTGRERTSADSLEGLRIFTDIYLIYQRGRWSFTSSFYAGQQNTPIDQRNWWQGNLITRYQINTITSLSARVEYFSDERGVVSIPLNMQEGFRTLGASLGMNIQPDANFLFRTEIRHFSSGKNVFERDNTFVNTSTTATVSFCAWF